VAAAYATLVAYLGDPDGVLAGHYADSLAALPEAGKTQGIAVGQAAAADLVALRANDGLNAPTATYGTPGPVVAGQWQLVPPATSAVTPWVGFMQPFLLDDVAQFRPAAPLQLDSRQWAKDFNEVKAYGALASSVRTPEQTAVAYFWNANTINQYNQVLREVVTRQDLDLVDAVRVLTMGDLVMPDALMACFDAKYEYLFWRPATAIRNAELDGNPSTTADPAWAPLLNTPGHPEYPSAHGCVTGAFAEVLATVLHTQRINLDIPGSMNGGSTLTTTRHFDTVAELDREIVDARVWIGFHFRSSTVAGVELGRDVARWELKRFFQPVKRR
jgi:hypothetical protein